MPNLQKITPCLWFDRNVEEAARFYVSIFEDSRILEISHYGKGMPLPEGTVLTVVFELAGQRFMGLNGGPQFPFTEAISMAVACDSQTEIDRFWEKLTADGGQPVQCGWLKDKFGLSWQIVPAGLGAMIQEKSERSGRVMSALLGMVKLDMAALQKAYDGR
jgi:predicted 3-demethylubiquinone-9 3-methyltransferase (glyoxalase superfamily)